MEFSRRSIDKDSKISEDPEILGILNCLSSLLLENWFPLHNWKFSEILKCSTRSFDKDSEVSQDPETLRILNPMSEPLKLTCLWSLLLENWPPPRRLRMSCYKQMNQTKTSDTPTNIFSVFSGGLFTHNYSWRGVGEPLLFLLSRNNSISPFRRLFFWEIGVGVWDDWNLLELLRIQKKNGASECSSSGSESRRMTSENLEFWMVISESSFWSLKLEFFQNSDPSTVWILKEF